MNLHKGAIGGGAASAGARRRRGRGVGGLRSVGWLAPVAAAARDDSARAIPSPRACFSAPPTCSSPPSPAQSGSAAPRGCTPPPPPACRDPAAAGRVRGAGRGGMSKLGYRTMEQCSSSHPANPELGRGAARVHSAPGPLLLPTQRRPCMSWQSRQCARAIRAKAPPPTDAPASAPRGSGPAAPPRPRPGPPRRLTTPEGTPRPWRRSRRRRTDGRRVAGGWRGRGGVWM
jgi:hypothetical protein